MSRLPRTGPQRKVIGHVWPPAAAIPFLRRHELLRCGDAQRPVQERFGATTNERRRCGQFDLDKQAVPRLAALANTWSRAGREQWVYDDEPLLPGLLGLPDR